MKKNLLIITAILAIIVVSFIFLPGSVYRNNNQEPAVSSTITSPPISVDPSTSSDNANILVTSPKPMQTVSLPIVIKGKARVFENQFNYRILDVNKSTILESGAYANSPDTGLFGDFEIQIRSLPARMSNELTIQAFDYSAKDGSEVDTVSVPVIFEPVNSMTVKAYFGNKKAPVGQECESVYPVEHLVVKTQATARAALEELFKGPMTIEKNKGFYTSINDGVKIQKLTIEKGVAKVDFDKRLEEGVGGSCKVTAIRNQITQTLKQFPTVKDVIISIDGRTEDILQP